GEISHKKKPAGSSAGQLTEDCRNPRSYLKDFKKSIAAQCHLRMRLIVASQCSWLIYPASFSACPASACPDPRYFLPGFRSVSPGLRYATHCLPVCAPYRQWVSGARSPVLRRLNRYGGPPG